MEEGSSKVEVANPEIYFWDISEFWVVIIDVILETV